MASHDLSFAKLIVIQEGIAELIVNEGVEVSSSMLDEYYDKLLSIFSGPFSVLINNN